MEKAERKYLNYLIELVRREDEDYIFLLEVLWRKEFYSLVNNDDNRAKDGIILRSEAGFDDNLVDFGPCRCLEMLIYLAKRCEFELYNGEITACFRDIFWELISNLGLEKYSKRGWKGTNVYFEIDEILNIWLERRYDEDGKGNIFPLKDPIKDQKTVEIWYQMQSYLLEKVCHKKCHNDKICDSFQIKCHEAI